MATVTRSELYTKGSVDNPVAVQVVTLSNSVIYTIEYRVDARTGAKSTRVWRQSPESDSARRSTLRDYRTDAGR